MSDILKAVVLGLVQGLTEFLPVSSSGHLVISGDLLGGVPGGIAEPGAEWVVCLHLATAVATVAVFRDEIWALLRDLAGGLARSLRAFSFSAGRERYPLFGLSLLLLLSGVPAGVAGALLRQELEALCGDAFRAGVALIVTGGLLWATRLKRRPQEGRGVGFVQAVAMGVAQAVALIPGISRSGATISTGMLCGTGAREAARFSFLMVLPPILAASLLEASEIESSAASELPALLLGFVLAAVTGYLALRWLLGIVQRGRLHRFAWYCWAVGLAVIVWKQAESALL